MSQGLCLCLGLMPTTATGVPAPVPSRVAVIVWPRRVPGWLPSRSSASCASSGDCGVTEAARTVSLDAGRGVPLALLLGSAAGAACAPLWVTRQPRHSRSPSTWGVTRLGLRVKVAEYLGGTRRGRLRHHGTTAPFARSGGGSRVAWGGGWGWVRGAAPARGSR